MVIIKKILFFLISLSAFFALSYGFVRVSWLFSQNAPEYYTLLIFSLFALLFLFYAVRKFLSELKKLPSKEEKKHFIKRTLYAMLRIVLVIAGLCLTVRFVFAGRTVPGLASLVILLAAAWAVRFLP
ncbi:MAG: hypothetical protein MJ183_04305 [Treponemataceae bacterium]|nr:hypothetical protein [Treponemataceae bacterium]